MKNAQGIPIDNFNKELNINDWVAFTRGNSIRAGVVIGFTPKGNPRVIELHRNFEFYTYPIAVGVNCGVIKIQPLIDKLP